MKIASKTNVGFLKLHYTVKKSIKQGKTIIVDGHTGDITFDAIRWLMKLKNRIRRNAQDNSVTIEFEEEGSK